MKWEKKDDDNIGFCTPDPLKGYIEEEVHIPYPLEKYLHDIAGDRIKDPMMDRPKPIVIPDPEIIAKIRDEIDSRGCFAVDVPKLVDVLFKLGIIVPREDFK